MSQPDTPNDGSSKTKEGPVMPIAQPLATLTGDEYWRVWTDAFDACFIYAKSGTLHGNINPAALYMDRRTGRGFLVDWEYSALVVAPGGYIPLCVSMAGLEKFDKPKSELGEVMKKVAEQQVKTKAEPEAPSLDQQAKDTDQEAPPVIPLSHGDEAEKPLVAPAVVSSSKGSNLEA